MLTFGPQAKIFLVTGVTDMRKSFDTLAAIVSGTLGEDPCSGHLYLFCNRSHNRLKILFYDRSGYWIFAKRLESGAFKWPDSADDRIELTQEELSLLLGGIDLRGAHSRRWYERPKDWKHESPATQS